MPSLYLTEPGSRLEKEYQRMLVTLDDEVLVEVPLEHLTEVILVGNVGVTTPALHSLLNAGIPMILMTTSGKLLGQLKPPMAENLPLRQAQFQRNEDTEFCLKIARQIVLGKIRNQRLLIQRIDRRSSDIDAIGQLAELDEALRAAQEATNLDELFGIEGQAARLYLSIFRQAIDPEWGFKKRIRRPPTDPVNALLSLGYTLLGNSVSSSLELVGLDPYLGYFHTEKYARPALALDLIEEFRAPIIDSMILNIVNHGWIKANDFEKDRESRGLQLKPSALRFFVKKYSEKLETPISVRQIKRILTYRKIIEIQARRLANVILGKVALYQPFRAR